MSLLERFVAFARKPTRYKWLTVKSRLPVYRVLNSVEEIRKGVEEIRKAVERSAIIEKEQYVAQALSTERYADPKRLERYGFKVYSQFDEDGIIQEIFRRIGTTDRRFIEFGVEDGLENNTLKLLLEGWHGLWIDGSEEYIGRVNSLFADVIANGRLTARCAFITGQNINELIGGWGTGEIDLLSIDIDGNDFHVWRAINVIKPRVVVIEHNAKFPPPLAIVQEYNPKNIWRFTDYMGASLEALVRLGNSINYSLVGTNFVGLNAFFVRNDLLDNKFQHPFSAENHYNRPKYFLWQLYVSGHPPDWGRYVEVPIPPEAGTVPGSSH
jgi:hypothetical protein